MDDSGKASYPIKEQQAQTTVTSRNQSFQFKLLQPALIGVK